MFSHTKTVPAIRLRTYYSGLPRDPPLAAYGLTQAQELAEYFLSLPEDQRPTIILSSPYCEYIHLYRIYAQYSFEIRSMSAND